jgi:polyhydroxyalkanoate synthesis regulator phasin
MASNERIRKYLDAGSVLGQVTRGRAEEIVRELVNAGEGPRDQAQEWMDNVVEQSRKTSESLIDTVRREVAAALKRIDPSALEQIANQVSEILRRSAEAGRNATKDATEAAKDATEHATRAAKDATEHATRAAKDATEHATKAAKGATERAGKAGKGATERASKAGKDARAQVEKTAQRAREAAESALPKRGGKGKKKSDGKKANGKSDAKKAEAKKAEAKKAEPKTSEAAKKATIDKKAAS